MLVITGATVFVVKDAVGSNTFFCRAGATVLVVNVFVLETALLVPLLTDFLSLSKGPPSLYGLKCK